ncbi:MAG: N-acyl homoserine lactonase family protein [Acidimicrobiales bacterium]
MRQSTLRRVDFGYFVRPAEETETGASRVEPCLGYLIDNSDGVLLIDTGMGSHPEVDAHYRPHRRPLPAALVAAGSSPEDVTVVVNCHLHFDHCGGNPLLAGRPVVVQAVELELAHGVDYTLSELVDAPGLRYTVVDGDAEVLPGVSVVPTPGHTAGHQSVVVRCSDGTVVVVAGQSHDTANVFGADALALRALRDGHDAGVPVPPEWMDRLQKLDPRRVYFAHDHAVWEP